MSPFAQSMFSQARGAKSAMVFVNRNVLWINVVAIIAIAMLCIAYVLQVNGSVANGYKMRDLETQIRELTITNRQMEVAAREAQSLDQVARSVKMIGLVDAGQPDYVAGSPPSYALAD